MDLQGFLTAIGSGMAESGVKMMAPVTQTLSTAIRAIRGTGNLAMGNVPAEQNAQAREAQMRPEYRPVDSVGGMMKTGVGMGLMAGTMMGASQSPITALQTPSGTVPQMAHPEMAAPFYTEAQKLQMLSDEAFMKKLAAEMMKAMAKFK